MGALAELTGATVRLMAAPVRLRSSTVISEPVRPKINPSGFEAVISSGA